MAQQNDFDFKAFNALCGKKPAGLQVALAKSLMKEVWMSMVFFDNIEAGEALDLCTKIGELQAKLKAQSEARAKKAS